ncbi:hypothetical protein M513_05187 [Trichuris suis]|uniref:Uncharacterized protein n=1 Tax=Trichuris suis TaxID=68888 RepID=A0A085M9M4_9BILA|nr:hypothetical protein M513_05187 [Trichuris suis]
MLIKFFTECSFTGSVNELCVWNQASKLPVHQLGHISDNAIKLQALKGKPYLELGITMLTTALSGPGPCQQADDRTRSVLKASYTMAFFPRSVRLLISWLRSLSAATFEPRYVNSGLMGPVAKILVFLMFCIKPHEGTLHSLFTFNHQGGVDGVPRDRERAGAQFRRPSLSSELSADVQPEGLHLRRTRILAERRGAACACLSTCSGCACSGCPCMWILINPLVLFSSLE